MGNRRDWVKKHEEYEEYSRKAKAAIKRDIDDGCLPYIIFDLVEALDLQQVKDRYMW